MKKAKPALPSPAPGGALALAGDLTGLREKLDEVRFADYFTILGFRLDETLPASAVERQHRALRQRFEPSRFLAVADRALESQLDELHRGLDEAREVLSDPQLRERYRQAIMDPRRP